MPNLPTADKDDDVKHTRNDEKVTWEDELMMEFVRDYSKDNGKG